MKNTIKFAVALLLLAPACGAIPGSPDDPAEICDMQKVFFVKKCFSGAAVCWTRATPTAESAPVSGCSVVLASATTGETYTAECEESCDE